MFGSTRLGITLISRDDTVDQSPAQTPGEAHYGLHVLPVPACCLHLNFSHPQTDPVRQSNLHIAVSAHQQTQTGCD